ncbi:MAG: hypothetical protein J0L75_19380 [Spirochaetes bacterium]|nr:hypothetical protein [Spirochaetota bacterium]
MNRPIGPGSALLFCLSLVLAGWAGDLVTFVPAQDVEILTQPGRILFDLRRWPSKPVHVYASTLQVYSNLYQNPALILDLPAEFVSPDRKIFALTNAEAGKTYEFFLATYIPRDRRLYLSAVYSVTMDPAPGQPTNAAAPLAGVVTNIVTNEVIHTLVVSVTNEVTNTVVQQVTNWAPIDLVMSVDNDERVVALRAPNLLKNPLKLALLEMKGGQTNQTALGRVEGGEGAPGRHWAFGYTNAPGGTGGTLSLWALDPEGKPLAGRGLEVFFPDAASPATTNVFEYPTELSRYQPVGHLGLFAVANLFALGRFTEAQERFAAIRTPETPDSSWLFWRAVLAYVARGAVEESLTGFARVIQRDQYRAEVFQARIWQGMITLQERPRQARSLASARASLDAAYAMPGESEWKDDILYYQALAWKRSGDAPRLAEHLRFIRNARLVHPLSTVWDISQKRPVELLPLLRALETDATP